MAAAPVGNFGIFDGNAAGALTNADLMKPTVPFMGLASLVVGGNPAQNVAVVALLSSAAAHVKRRHMQVLQDDDDFSAYLCAETISTSLPGALTAMPGSYPQLFKEYIMSYVLNVLAADALYAAAAGGVAAGPLNGDPTLTYFTAMQGMANPPVATIATTYQGLEAVILAVLPLRAGLAARLMTTAAQGCVTVAVALAKRGQTSRVPL